MSIQLLNDAFKAQIKPSTLKFVYVALADYANDVGEAYPSVETLENRTGQNRKTILNNLSKLCEMGYLEDTGERKGRTGQVKVYRVLGAETVPKTEQYQKRNSTKNGTGKSPKNGTLKESQKRYSEPPVSFNHQSNHQIKTQKTKKVDEFAEFKNQCNPQHWDDWLIERKKKRMGLTLTALQAMTVQAEKAGMSFSDAVTHCAENNWGGFKAYYLKNKNNNRGFTGSQGRDKFRPSTIDHSGEM